MRRGGRRRSGRGAVYGGSGGVRATVRGGTGADGVRVRIGRRLQARKVWGGVGFDSAVRHGDAIARDVRGVRRGEFVQSTRRGERGGGARGGEERVRAGVSGVLRRGGRAGERVGVGAVIDEGRV